MMDRERFDALTRLLGAEGSRRTALGAVLGATLLGTSFPLESGAVKKDKKQRRRRRRRNRPNQPGTCFGTEECEFPSPGKDFENCDFAGTDLEPCSGCDFRRADLADTDFEGGNFQGASFRATNLRGADLSFADVSGASFRDACLVGADFFGANTDGAHFGDAILCGTRRSDGRIDDSGCDDTDACCPPCLAVGDACGEGIDGDCCDTQCVEGFCQSECESSDDCSEGEVCCDNLCRAGNCCFDGDCEPFGNTCVSTFCQCGDGPTCEIPEVCVAGTCDEIAT